MPVELLRRQFTVTEYNRMIEAGILTKYDHVELIKGEIIQMAAIGRRHASCVNRLAELFFLRLAQAVTIGVQNPVELDDNSEPQPNLSILRRRADFYKAGHPQPEDVLLLIEVADSTIEYDQEVKIPLYASSNIAEVWLVDINQQVLEVYREPTPNGYQNIQKLQPGQIIAMQAFSDVNFTVEEVLG